MTAPTKAATTLKSNVSGQQPGMMLSLFNYGWYTNDWDKLQRWDGMESTSKDAAFPAAPTDWTGSDNSITSGAFSLLSNNPGQHMGNAKYANGRIQNTGTNKVLLRYRYKENRSKWVGNPSNLLILVATNYALATDDTIQFNIDAVGGNAIKRSTDSKIDEIIIERTTRGGNVFYVTATVANTASSVTVTISATTDAALADSQNLPDWPEIGHNAPPYASVMTAGRGHLFMGGHTVFNTGTTKTLLSSTAVRGIASTDWKSAVVDRFFEIATANQTPVRISALVSSKALTLVGDYASAFSGAAYRIWSPETQYIYWSHPGLPCSFPPENKMRVLRDSSDQITGMAFLGQNLYVFGPRSMEQISWSQDPFTAIITPVPGGRGLVAKNMLILHNGALWGFDYMGMWRFDGGSQPSPVTQLPKIPRADLLTVEQGDRDYSLVMGC